MKKIYTLNTETTAQRILELRKEKGLSEAELGALCGVTRSCINVYEKEKLKDFPVSKIIKLANALETSPDYLLGWSNKR